MGRKYYIRKKENANSKDAVIPLKFNLTSENINKSEDITCETFSDHLVDINLEYKEDFTYTLNESSEKSVLIGDIDIIDCSIVYTSSI